MSVCQSVSQSVSQSVREGRRKERKEGRNEESEFLSATNKNNTIFINFRFLKFAIFNQIRKDKRVFVEIIT